MIKILRWLHCDDTITYKNLCLDDLKPLIAYTLIAAPGISTLIRVYF